MKRWTPDLHDVVRWVLPPRCVVCGEPGDDGEDFCQACHDALPWIVESCRRCALPRPAQGDCRRCRRRPLPFDEVHAPLRYAFPIDQLVPRLKFHGDLAAGRQLARLMCLAFRDVPPPEALVPVPLHRQRLGQRGYDQALELARPLASSLGIPLLAHALQRTRATEAQSSLSAHARRRNLKDAFEVRGPVPGHVALVDDVMTTGHTLAECAMALRGAGVERVDVWVLARAVGPG